jgi:hypothetical protein
LVATVPVSADVVVESYPFTSLALPVADNGVPLNYGFNLDGTSAITSLTEVQVSMILTGSPVGTGWAGDLFASLNHDFSGQTAILLNQVGVNGGNAFGHGFSGWQVTFRDGAANGDIHLGQPNVGTILTGTWQADGRLHPLDVGRPNQLNVFNGFAGTGNWTLTLADLAPGGTMTLDSFTLTLTGETAAVPEPAATTAWTAAALLAGGLWMRRQRR